MPCEIDHGYQATCSNTVYMRVYNCITAQKVCGPAHDKKAFIAYDKSLFYRFYEQEP